MKFNNFNILFHLIWFVPGLLMFYIWAIKKKKTIMEKFAQKGLFPEIIPAYANTNKISQVWLNIFAIVMIVAALARPQWGFFWKESEYKGLDLLMAVDTSKSMLATDISPNRLAFSKGEIGLFIKKLKGDRVGLIAFAGTAFLQCPLTTDHRGLLLALTNLNVNTIPKGGTSLPRAIDTAIRNYKDASTKNKVLIIITDGENTSGDVNKAIDAAIKEGITIHCIGIGTTKGEIIPVSDEKGDIEYIRDKNGKLVKSKLMEQDLRMIAKKTGGIYVYATQANFGLEQIYREGLSKLDKKKTEDKKVRVYKERFQFPLVIAFFLLLYELILSTIPVSGRVPSGTNTMSS